MGGYDPEAELMSDLRDFRAEMTAAKLEIARLQAEVERLTDFIRHIDKVNGEMHGGMVAVAKSEVAAAWNDAIDAAAREVDCEGCRGSCMDPANCHKVMAQDIRALKRT